VSGCRVVGVQVINAVVDNPKTRQPRQLDILVDTSITVFFQSKIHPKMKYLFLLLLLLSLIFGDKLAAQDVRFQLENPQVSNGGLTYEVDVMIASTAAFKLGSGQLYFNYNNLVLGENIAANAKINIVRPAGSVLSTKIGPFDFYKDFIVNDNTTSRVSFAWQHGFSAGCLGVDNVTAAPVLLFRINVELLPGAAGASPDLCFESSELFSDQTFTACGPGSCDNANCQANPGIQLVNDTYICLNGGLPVELLDFRAVARGKEAILNWQTGQEVNSSHFAIERSDGGRTWQEIGSLEAAGESNTLQNYNYVDNEFHLLATGESDVFYRLRLVDQDDTFSYSNIEALGTGEGVSNVRIYPNPTSDRAYIVLDQPLTSAAIVTLHDVTGKVVYRKNWTADAPRQLPLNFGTAHFPPGVYVVRMTQENGREAFAERLVVTQ
jgi:hypothetical protein